MLACSQLTSIPTSNSALPVPFTYKKKKKMTKQKDKYMTDCLNQFGGLDVALSNWLRPPATTNQAAIRFRCDQLRVFSSSAKVGVAP